MVGSQDLEGQNPDRTCVATRHRQVGMLASFEFTLEYQKGADNEAADALEGTMDRGEAVASEELLCEHEHLGNEVQVQLARMAPLHKVDWGEAQKADPMLATCRRWLCTHKDTPFLKRDVLLKGS